MTDCHTFTHLDASDARRALELLGCVPDDTGIPQDPDEQASGFLAAILAAAQAHIQTRVRHASTIERVYHSMFEHFTGVCPEDCGDEGGRHRGEDVFHGNQ